MSNAPWGSNDRASAQRCAPSTLCPSKAEPTATRLAGHAANSTLMGSLQPSRHRACRMLPGMHLQPFVIAGDDPAGCADTTTSMLLVQVLGNRMEAPSIRPGFWWSPTLEDQHPETNLSNSSPPCLDEAVLLSNGSGEYPDTTQHLKPEAHWAAATQRTYAAPLPAPRPVNMGPCCTSLYTTCSSPSSPFVHLVPPRQAGTPWQLCSAAVALPARMQPGWRPLCCPHTPWGSSNW